MATPFTRNSEEVRLLLQQNGFTPLSFFQGKEFVFPIITHWQNSQHKWIEKTYATRSKEDLEEMDCLEAEESQLEDFITKANQLK